MRRVLLWRTDVLVLCAESGVGVTIREEIKFHSDRAVVELDCGLRAKSVEAAKAHYDLSALHFDKMRELGRNSR